MAKSATAAHLTASENLKVGLCDVKQALDLVPELRPLRRRRDGLLSGGEQITTAPSWLLRNA
jgi:ABC-type branched-subunit amino acid transport system ATPase component